MVLDILPKTFGATDLYMYMAQMRSVAKEASAGRRLCVTPYAAAQRGVRGKGDIKRTASVGRRFTTLYLASVGSSSPKTEENSVKPASRKNSLYSSAKLRLR